MLVERMRTAVREAFSYGIRHVIRHVHWDSVSYDQIRVRPWETIPRIIPRIPQYGVWYSAECMHWNSKKSVVNHFKNRLKLWKWKKNVSHKSHSVYLMKIVNKRGERSSQSYYKSNVSPYGSVLSFILYGKQWRMKLRMRTAELVKIWPMIRGCAVWVNDSYRVMP